MKQKPSSRRRGSSTKSVLRLPDLEHAKAAVVNSLNSADAKRGYRHAIDEFVDGYCSEPRLAFNRIVVLRHRSHLESRQLAPGLWTPNHLLVSAAKITEPRKFTIRRIRMKKFGALTLTSILATVIA